MRRRRLLRASATLGVGPTEVISLARGERRADGTEQSYGPVGSVEIPAAREAVVADDTAYVATVDGYSVVDLSDPTSPRVIADRAGIGPPDADQPFDFVWDVSYDDDRLLVPAQGRPDDHTLGFALEDVSEPADPTTVRTVRTEFSIHNGVLDGDRVYLTAGEDPRAAFSIYDATDGSRLGAWSVIDADPDYDLAYESGPTAHDLSVFDTRRRTLAAVACWDAGTWLVDVTDPAAPSALGRAGGFDPLELAELSERERDRQGTLPPGNHHNTAFAGRDTLFVGKESWGIDGSDGVAGGPSGIDVFDVSDPTAPNRVARIDPVPTPRPSRRFGITTTAHNFDVHEGTLLSSWYRGGVKRHDVSDPSTPERRTYWRDPATTSFWAARAHRPGETFLAVSKPFSPAGTTDTVPGGVYLFPDEPGRSVEPFDAETTDATPGTPTATPDATETTTGTEASAAGTTDASDSTDASDGTGRTTGVRTPGFGPLAGIAGVVGAGAAWRRWHGDDGE